MKICSKCGIEKPFSEFNKRPERLTTPYRSSCKMCSSKAAKDKLANSKSEEELASLQALRILVGLNSDDGLDRFTRHRSRLRAREQIPIPLEKHCRGCAETKPAECFSQNKSCLNGLNYFCKNCMALRCKKARSADPEKARERGRRSAKVHRPACAERNRRYEAQKLQAEQFREALGKLATEVASGES